MESGTKEENLSETKEQSKESNKVFLITVVIVATVIIGVLGYVLFVNGGILGENQVWYFKGAYANYEGSTNLPFTSVDFSMRLEIVDFNSTHLKTLYDVELDAGILGKLLDEQNTTWISKEQINKIGFEDLDSFILIDTYEDQVYLESIGTKDCNVYVYSSPEDEMAMTITVYVDNQVNWPIKFSVNMNPENTDLNLGDLGLNLPNTSILFEVELTDTNIPDFT
ncbi:MAG: hypothetical protein P8Y18_00325 [Candidatus Bathyarchaeota archaeon]